MTVTEKTLLDEWRSPERDVRIAIDRIETLRDVSEQYVAPQRSARLVWNYVRRVGAREALRKVRSRLAEGRRNRKVAAFGAGTVLEAPAASGFAAGDEVRFFAPSVASDARRIVVDMAFVMPKPAGHEAGDGARDLPPELAPYAAWSRWSGIPLDETAIGRGLNRLNGPAGPQAPPAGGSERDIADRRIVPRRHPGRLSAAIFGLGNYAKQLIVPNIPAAFELACVHELDPLQLAGWNRRDVTLDTCPWPRDEEHYDLWFVAGFHSTHARIACAALARGGAAAVEKPLATTAGDLDALRTALQAEPGARLFTCFQRRHAIYNDWVREDLGAGPGAPINYDCIVYEIPLSPLHWYSWPSSGSRLISNGCHWIDHFMLLNDYAEVISCTVVPGAHNGSTTCLTLANGAEMVMRLTEIGTPRIGVRDHVEISLGQRTATIRNQQYYTAEDSLRTLRRAKVNPIQAYVRMYRDICRKVRDGGGGDGIESLRSTEATLTADAEYQRLTKRT